MTAVRVIGVDPGPTPGMVLFEWAQAATPLVHVVQCNHEVAPVLLETLIHQPHIPTIVAIERFVIGRKSMRAGRAGEITRNLIGELSEVAGAWYPKVQVLQHAATTVKPWATDARLDAAGLLAATKGMQHARDAARHALFAAVKYGRIPDPLSRKAS